MSGHIWSVFRYELKRNLLRKGFLISTFGIPLLGFIVFFGYQLFFSPGSPEEQMAELEFSLRGIETAGYVDYSGEFPQPQALAGMMIAYEDEAGAQAALDAGEIDVYYIIAEEYMETGSVRLIAPHFTPSHLTEAPIRQLLFGRVMELVNPPTLQRLYTPAVIETIQLQPDEEEGVTRDFGVDFALVYGFAIIFMLALFGTNGYLMQTVIEEKETRLIEILISSVRPIQLLTGKVLAMGLMGLFQVAVYVSSVFIITTLAANMPGFAGTFLANITFPVGALPLLLVYFVLGYLMFAAIFGAIGALSSSMSDGPNLALIFTFPAVGPLYFLSVFIDNPHSPVAVIMSLFPLTAPMTVIMRLSITSVPAVQVALSIAILVLTIIFMLWVAGRLFRVQTLLAGQRPKLREIPRLIRA
jgi:ABC-2 type transport system permease protein